MTESPQRGFYVPARAVLLALYCAGLAHWAWFFQFAKLRALDWRLTLGYQAVLRDAILRFRIPYVSTFEHYTNRYLGSPETPLSPQYLLTPWLDAWTFNLFNICLLYSAAFIGLLRIRRQYRLSLIPFTAHFLMFNFNGYLVSRAGVGHSMWFGYFFLPYFYEFLLRLYHDRNDKRALVLLSGVLVLMELQGSFHLFVWCLMLLGLTAIFKPSRFRPLVTAAVWPCLLCAFRFLPSAVSLSGKPLEFIPGYPTLGYLLDAFVVIRPSTWDLSETGTGWWEFDCYIGVAGLALLVWFTLVYPRRNPSKWYFEHRALYIAMACMAALSIGNIYHYVVDLPIPLLNSQRVPSRFIVIPFTACLVLTAIQMQQFLDSEQTGVAARWVFAFALIPIAIVLYHHSMRWAVREVEVAAWKDWMRPAENITVLSPDMSDPGIRTYVHTVWLSAALSFMLGIHWFYCLVRAPQTRRTQTS